MHLSLHKLSGLTGITPVKIIKFLVWNRILFVISLHKQFLRGINNNINYYGWL